MMNLLFQGELPPAMVVPLAATVAAAVVWFYRRETRRLGSIHAWSLPLLRGGAVFLTLLVLAGPVLRHQRVIGTIPRVDVFVDASDSMLVRDGDGPTRLQRVWHRLSGDGDHPGWLEEARQTHHIFLHQLMDDQARLIWDSRSDRPIPTGADLIVDDSEAVTKPGRITNLSDPIAIRVLTEAGDAGDAGDSDDRSSAADDSSTTPSPPGTDATSAGSPPTRSGPRRAVLLLSDGQHNAGASPQSLAQRLGDATIPVYTVGVGAAAEPRDVAMLGIDVPGSVAANGRASGQLTIKDLAGEGESVRVRITMGNQTVWQQTLPSENRVSRRIAFDFAVGPLVAQLQASGAEASGIAEATAGRGSGIERSRITLSLQATVEPISDQFFADNNALDFRLAANLRQRRLLIVDSRSRWETRYLRNLFDRDPTWQVDTVLAWPRSSGGNIRRHLIEGNFPADAPTMAGYDAVIWGDCGADAFDDDQLKRVRDFVSQGGAIAFIDGDRDGLKGLVNSPVGPLLPVKFGGDAMVDGVVGLRPTALGSAQPALRLGDDDSNAPITRRPDGRSSTTSKSGLTDAADLASNWDQIRPPTAIRSTEVLPGAEVWLEATVDEASAPVPALVTRLFGGGQVVYLAFDQTWRWRYRVADRDHTRFWNQLLEAIMQPPFEVRDQYVALATDAPQYTAGDSATIRARLRDGEGNPVGDAIVEAVLRAADGETRTVLLRSIDSDRGVYEGRSPPLVAGEWELFVRAAGYQASESVRSSILVVPPPNRESWRIAQDADLLRSLADVSGGVYADEQDADTVWRAINPLSEGRIETRRYALTESYPWFAAILGLLTVEWWWRKKSGLI